MGFVLTPMSVLLDFFKKHWKTLAFIVIVVIGYLWIRSQNASMVQTIKEINESHDTAIDQINKARREESMKHEQQMKELRDSLARIEEEHDKALKSLEEKKVEQQQQIVKKYGNDADGLAALVADRFGFKVEKSQP